MHGPSSRCTGFAHAVLSVAGSVALGVQVMKNDEDIEHTLIAQGPAATHAASVVQVGAAVAVLRAGHLARTAAGRERAAGAGAQRDRAASAARAGPGASAAPR